MTTSLSDCVPAALNTPVVSPNRPLKGSTARDEGTDVTVPVSRGDRRREKAHRARARAAKATGLSGSLLIQAVRQPADVEARQYRESASHFPRRAPWPPSRRWVRCAALLLPLPDLLP